MGSVVKAFAPCWSCGRAFWYGVATVPTVPVDRAGQPTSDTGEQAGAYRTAPICPACVDEVNVERVRAGLPPIPYDPHSTPPPSRLLDADVIEQLRADAPTADDLRVLGSVLAMMPGGSALDGAAILANADALADNLRRALDEHQAAAEEADDDEHQAADRPPVQCSHTGCPNPRLRGNYWCRVHRHRHAFDHRLRRALDERYRGQA